MLQGLSIAEILTVTRVHKLAERLAAVLQSELLLQYLILVLNDQRQLRVQ